MGIGDREILILIVKMPLPRLNQGRLVGGDAVGIGGEVAIHDAGGQRSVICPPILAGDLGQIVQIGLGGDGIGKSAADRAECAGVKVDELRNVEPRQVDRIDSAGIVDRQVRIGILPEIIDRIAGVRVEAVSRVAYSLVGSAPDCSEWSGCRAPAASAMANSIAFQLPIAAPSRPHPIDMRCLISSWAIRRNCHNQGSGTPSPSESWPKL